MSMIHHLKAKLRYLCRPSLSHCFPLPACGHITGIPPPWSTVQLKAHHNGFNSGLQVPLCTIIRHSSSTPITGTPATLPLDDWKTIYRFNHIIPARAIQRLKIYQTGFTCFILLPWSLISYGNENLHSAHLMLAVSAFACMMLVVMGTMSSRIVGFLYVDKKDPPTKLRVARLSFFGSRVDTILPVDTFLPITDCSENLADAYVVLQKADPEKSERQLSYFFEILREFVPALFEDKYYLSLKYGTIYDPDTFYSIFGNLSHFESK